jgi:hypothetical protein
MSSRMSMMFSQNVGFTGKISRRPLPLPSLNPTPLPAPAPVQHLQMKARAVTADVMMTSRSAPRNVKQLFNLGHIMANPGMPCKACGS